MPESYEDPRLPKKQRRWDEAPSDATTTDNPTTMDFDNPSIVALVMKTMTTSYKDMLIGDSDNTRVVEYESLLVVCFNYGIYGHKSDICPRNRGDEDNTPPSVAQDKLKPENSESLGPWMLVDRKQCHQPRKPPNADVTTKNFLMQQSKYNLIFKVNDNTSVLRSKKIW
ncbi:hypothetical protein V6N13_064621 [Hibiscus sabdariffa]